MTIGKNGAMQMSTQKKKQTPIEKLAALIVDKRKAFYLFYIIAGIFCAISTGWTKVNNDITSYLPDSSETRIGLDLMNDQFVTYGSGSIMLDNVTFEKAEEIASELEEIDGVTSVTVENDEDSYKNGSALLSVTFDGEEDDQISKDAMKAVKEKLEPYDEYINSAVGNSSSETIAAEMQTVVVIVLVIIIGVLFFTSHTYMEIPVLLMTFGMAALLNMGTNFMFGEISFVSNSIAVVLQLALAIDYAIILCNRYTEERTAMDARDAVVTALSKAIPEISSSCLTTLSGMVAMMLMQFKLGFDLQPIAHSSHLWNLLGMVLVGWGSVLLGGCPLRQLILAAQGNGDSAITVFGMLVGAALAHNFGLAGNPDSKSEAGELIVGGISNAGKIAVVLGLVVMLVVVILNLPKKEEAKA